MRTLVALLAFSAGCLGPLSIPTFPDAGPRLDASRVHLAVDVQDARGAPRPLDAIPRLPRLRFVGLGDPDPTSPAVLVLHGGADDVRDDFDARPLRASTLARAVPADATRDPDGALVLVPRAPLLPGETVTIAVAPWAIADDGAPLGRATVLDARVSTSPLDGASPIDAWPADGTSGVPCAVDLVVLRFDGDVDGESSGVALLGPDGAAVPAAVARAPCAMLGFRDAAAITTCITVRPAEKLLPAREHRLVTRAPLVDRTGASLAGFAASFTTENASGATPPPALVDVTCDVDEQPIETDAGTLCVLADDLSVSVRGQSTTPARVFLASLSASTATVAMDGAFALRLDGLLPDAALPAALALVDAADRRTTPMLDLHTSAPLATISITEVRADPLGPDPVEEYVELRNYGDVQVDLAGFTLSDRADATGDVLVAPRPLPAGARALVVADGFALDDGADDAAPAGTLLVRAGPSIGAGGLPAHGVALYLRDLMHRRLSASPALAAPEGACIVRTATDARDGSAGTFAVGACTPAR